MTSVDEAKLPLQTTAGRARASARSSVVTAATALPARPGLRSDVGFSSGGIVCRGWWYDPEAAGLRGCVVMAHGLGGLRSAGLEPDARRFAEAGFAVLRFDYRHFGASDGQPRPWVSVRRQLADWAAAVAFARGQAGVDPDRVALWGRCGWPTWCAAPPC